MSKKNRHGHHGGAWKVAYADFVTAMMAFFLVMWIVSQDQKIKEAVERSFRHPFGSLTKESTGIIPNKEVAAVKNTSGNFDSSSAIELNFLRKLSEELMKSLKADPDDPSEANVKMELLPDGMRISIFDRTKRPVFEPDSASFTRTGAFLFETLAWEVARFTNAFNIELEGHTERGRPPKSASYGNWELSTDRANAARRKLLDHDVQATQIKKVAGFADTMPMPDVPPQDERNRRVAILLRVQDQKSN